MKLNILKTFLFFVTVGLSSCTQSGNSSAFSSVTDAVKDIISPDSSVNTVEKQVAEIQKKINQDVNYALTQEDIQFLQSQGLVADNSELMAWVK